MNVYLSYHLYCRKYTKEYNVKAHEHEILFSIYLFNRIRDIQSLLNDLKMYHYEMLIKSQRDLLKIQKEASTKYNN
jgi:hypothetical protein